MQCKCTQTHTRAITHTHNVTHAHLHTQTAQLISQQQLRQVVYNGRTKGFELFISRKSRCVLKAGEQFHYVKEVKHRQQTYSSRKQDAIRHARGIRTLCPGDSCLPAVWSRPRGSRTAVWRHGVWEHRRDGPSVVVVVVFSGPGVPLSVKTCLPPKTGPNTN